MKASLLTYRIETDRLLIRPYRLSDAAMLKQSIDESIAHLKPWMPWVANEPESLEAKQERIKSFEERFNAGKDYTMGIFNLEETQLLGSTGFHDRIHGNALEIGYWTNVRHVGKGIATEATRALTKVGFELELLARVEIHCDVQNSASARIPERCGYKLREIQPAVRVDSKGNVSDTMIWQMTREQYFARPFDMEMRAFDKEGRRISEGK
jgi:RimJ/RimL family protein N-acetyltransferase